MFAYVTSFCVTWPRNTFCEAKRKIASNYYVFKPVPNYNNLNVEKKRKLANPP